MLLASCQFCPPFPDRMGGGGAGNFHPPSKTEYVMFLSLVFMLGLLKQVFYGPNNMFIVQDSKFHIWQPVEKRTLNLTTIDWVSELTHYNVHMSLIKLYLF